MKEAIPNHQGDWYFTGEYPTPGMPPSIAPILITTRIATVGLTNSGRALYPFKMSSRAGHFGISQSYSSMQKTALLSVSDKTGLVPFARALVDEHGYRLLSTGGTAALLEKEGVAVTEVSDHTGFPEMMEGRVKTLHPMIHGGLLARRDKADHMEAAAAHGIDMIDLVVVNLYPFEETVAKPDVTYEQAIENIDIGGPSMLRSAAKNHASVTVVVDVADYNRVLSALSDAESLGRLRRELASRFFSGRVHMMGLFPAILVGRSKRMCRISGRFRVWWIRWRSSCLGSRSYATGKTRIRRRLCTAAFSIVLTSCKVRS